APSAGELLHGRWLVLRRGKKNLAAVELVPAGWSSPRHSAAGPSRSPSVEAAASVSATGTQGEGGSSAEAVRTPTTTG
ncbi:hypothetical protein ACFWNF_06385, partial [Streptomyces anulatus]|uniref:hypothetical protein n=1 Tax=Streptomyces anulatus TaxID=1892 RepID=UPI003664C18D